VLERTDPRRRQVVTYDRVVTRRTMYWGTRLS
jgi:hypothetical protein